MTKWADLVITKVKYNRDHTQIVEVEVRTDTGETIANDVRRMTRQEVIIARLRGTTFVTAYLQNGQWQKGATVEVVTIHGERFITTEGNSRKNDNLGSLPEYT